MLKGIRNKFLRVSVINLLVVAILFTTLNVAKAQTQQNDFSTTNTFESDGGTFGYEYLLSKYNAFSFDDLLVGVGHINGPIIAKGRAGRLKMADYNFQDILEKIKKGEDPAVMDSQRLGFLDSENYFDQNPTPSVYVQGYAKISGAQVTLKSYFGSINKINKKMSGDEIRYELNKENHEWGGLISDKDGEAYLTDNYLEWDRMLRTLKEESNNILNDTNNIEINNLKGNYVTVKEGQNVVISENVYNDPNFEYILFLAANDDQNTGPFNTEKTIITYDVEGAVYLKKVRWAENEEDRHNDLEDLKGYFPGDKFAGTGEQKYDKNATELNLIHHYPNENIIGSEPNGIRFGQLFAPTSDYYDGGGNLNGNSIVNRYIVKGEPHMWPFSSKVADKSTSFEVKKVWQGTTLEDQFDVEVQLYQNGVEYGDKIVLTSPDYSYTWENLELQDSSGNEYVYTVDELNKSERFDTSIDGGTITNTLKVADVETIDITGTKKWLGGPAVKPDITIELYQNDVKIHEITLSDGNTNYSFNDLVKFDTQGNEYIYTIKEKPVDGYITKIDGYDLTNIHSISILGTKTWINGPDQKPDITISLLRDGIIIDEFILSNGATTYRFDNLPAVDENGIEYLYTVSENDVENYKSNQDGFDFTNTYQPSLTSIHGSKRWIGGPLLKPTVIIELYRNDIKLSEYILVDGETDYQFTELPTTDDNGNEYHYSVKEKPVDNYTSVQNGFDFTNTYVSPKISISGTKTWIGGPVEKPNVTIELYRNGIYFDHVVITDGNTSFEFTDLDETDAAGVKYNYTVRELSIDNYLTTQDGNDFTNTYNENKIVVSGTKIWINGPINKPTITIELYRNGVLFDEINLLNGNTTYQFENLDKTDASGKDYDYTVKEVDVEDYDSSQDGYNFTNTYVSPKTSISGVKTWVGGPSIKPTITIELYRNGELVDSKDLVNGVTNYEFKDLDLNNNQGEGYVYTVKEIDVEDYESTQDGYNFTNTYVSPKTSISGVKTWVGGPSVKPTITIELYRNSELVDSKDLVDGVTIYEFIDLDETDTLGNKYDYTVKEQSVEDYESSIVGFDITNTYTKNSTIDFEVEKVWVGGPALKPTITIQLLQNGSLFKTVDLENGTLSYTFTDLPEYDENYVPYVYTVEELPVESYESEIQGGVIINTYLGELTFDYEVSKVWVGGPIVKPDITIQLIQNGDLLETVILKDGQLNHVFKDLPIYDGEGYKYVYEVVELDVDGYESRVVGNEITNTYIEIESELFSISGYKKDRHTGINLEGARIELWKENGDTYYRAVYTDKDGFFKFTDLEAGKYIVIETIAPIGYELDSPEVEVDLDGDDVVNVIFRNTKKGFFESSEKPKLPDSGDQGIGGGYLPATGIAIGKTAYFFGLIALGSFLLGISKREEEQE